MSRGGVDFTDIHAEYTTYKLNTADAIVEADEGKAVTNTGNGEAGYGTLGDPLLGVLSRVEADGYGSVQDEGYVTVTYASAAIPPAVGKPVVVNGAGLVSQATAAIVGRSNCIVSVDTTNSQVVVLLG
jgi:hypothetical protein